MTLGQTMTMDRLTEQLEHRIQQERAVKEKLDSITGIFEYVRADKSRLERNIDRVAKGLPLEEEEPVITQDITDWIY